MSLRKILCEFCDTNNKCTQNENNCYLRDEAEAKILSEIGKAIEECPKRHLSTGFISHVDGSTENTYSDYLLLSELKSRIGGK